jgi:hypothetical protein
LARRRWAFAIAAAAVVILAALVGVYAVAGLAPERLRVEVERLLADATGAPVELGSLRLVVGFPMHLEGQGLDLWNSALAIDYVAARLSPLSLLVGKPRLSALEVKGVALTMTQSADGRWTPDFDPEAPPPPPAGDEPLLGLLETFERIAREGLDRPTLADSIAVERAQIRYVDAERGEELVRLEELRGLLVHRALRGDAEIRLNAQIRVAGGAPAAIEAQGLRSRGGALDLSMAVTALDVDTLVIGRGRPLRGRLSGILDYEAPSPGTGDLALDFVLEDFEVRAPGEPSRVLETPRFAARVRASLSPLQLDIEDASVSAGPLNLQVAATLERPVDATSHLGLTLVVDDVDLDRARTIVAWLPEEARESSEEFMPRIESGLLTRIEGRGSARLDEWRRLFDGRTKTMPWGMRLVTDVDGLTIDVGEGDKLEMLSGRFVWTADRVEARLHEGSLNGSPLPELDAEVRGVSHLFAAEPAMRELLAGAEPLPGLKPLWEVLWGDVDDGGDSAATVILELDYVHHPALLWPLDGVRARIEPQDGSTRIEIERGEWAGIPLDGHALIDAREDRVQVRLVADEPARFVGPSRPRSLLETPSEAGRIWAMGRFEVGAIDGESWRQRSAVGDFQASGDEIDITTLTVMLEPRGELRGAGWIELGLPDRALFTMETSLTDGDVETLLRVVGTGEGVRGGVVAVEASLAGALAPGLPLLSRLSGDASVEATAGAIEASVPALLALALATDTLNAFGGHDQIRYDTVKTDLHFSEGRVSTEAFDIDGPDLRMFVSGELDLLREPHLIEAELALFLFRHIDQALVNIPIVNALLLGGNDNLMAAYFSLTGPWEDPVARPMALRTLTESPAGDVLTGIPRVVAQGLRALGTILGGGGDTRDSKPSPRAPRGNRAEEES